ncbi:hypothetical protein ACJIZ3_014534 [Penstemon smallii]|uniref:Uncharacterized protein n=1 Tax=Penstemon smallii TaxID=265156 RepID=A0ABD3RRG8_9LAMI
MGQSMRFAIFNDISKHKLLVVAGIRFSSMIVMLKRFKLIKLQLQSMVISEQWCCYRDDVVDYIFTFTDPIYSRLRFCDTDKPCLH